MSLLSFAKRSTVNLDLSNKCTLACPRCARALYDFTNSKVPGKELDIADFKKIIKYFNTVCFGGQISDPTLHSKFHQLLEIAHISKIAVEVHVAASHRPVEWFDKAFDANPNAKWFFGIDGLPESSSKYRIRQDGQKLFDMMRRARQKGLHCVWQYIIFAYNENDIEQAKTLAANINVEFLLLKSSRFLKDDEYRPSEGNYLYRPQFNNYVEKLVEKYQT